MTKLPAPPRLVRGALVCLLALLVASCAAQPLKLYPLSGGSPPAPARPPDRPALVIQLARVTLPDDLDTSDIVVRHGDVLERSRQGRWATRLSLGVTDFLAAELARRRPAALVTSQPQATAPSYRILINISRLDVSAAGEATLDADWTTIPHDPALAARHERGHFRATGAVATDQNVVELQQAVLRQLADAIKLGGLR